MITLIISKWVLFSIFAADFIIAFIIFLLGKFFGVVEVLDSELNHGGRKKPTINLKKVKFWKIFYRIFKFSMWLTLVVLLVMSGVHSL